MLCTFFSLKFVLPHSGGMEIVVKKIDGFSKGMGIGGWLTNYKRFNVLPEGKRRIITIGDMEHFRTYITEWDAENIAAMSVDHVRIGFDQLVMEEAPYKYRDEIFALLKDFVTKCIGMGLKVVLNLHKAIGNYCDIQEVVTLFDSDELQKRFVALWLKIEADYSDYPEVMFELLNEVRDVNADLWNNLAEKTIYEIRKVNKNRKIIVGSRSWNSAYELENLRVYDDENVIYTFHNYTPFEFTHQQGVLQSDCMFYNRKLSYPCDDIERYRDYYRIVCGSDNAYSEFERIDINVLRAYLKGAKSFIEKYPDKILWCGEFGTIRHCDLKSRENWMADMIQILQEMDIPYCVWNYLSTPNDGNRFSLVDDETRQILSERMKRIINGDIR